jgi:TonB family protein
LLARGLLQSVEFPRGARVSYGKAESAVSDVNTVWDHRVIIVASADAVAVVGGRCMGVARRKLVFPRTPSARRKKLGGTSVVSLIVDAAGNPQDVRVLRSQGEGVSKKLRPTALGLDENAVKAVKEYRFEPAEFKGKPVPVETTVEISYHIY